MFLILRVQDALLVRMTYLNYGQNSFSEHGADAALHVKGRDSSIGFSTMGVKLATSVNIDYIGQYGNRQTSSGGSGSFHYKF